MSVAVVASRCLPLFHAVVPLLAVAGCLCLATPGAAQDQAPVTKLSEEECRKRRDALDDVLKQFSADCAHNITFSEKDLRDRTFAYSNRLFWHLLNEDGTVRPVRTGSEVRLYNKIKAFVRGNFQHQERNYSFRRQLEYADLFRMGLEAVGERPESYDVNVLEVILTVHNVVRMLARPEQWTSKVGIQKAPEPTFYGHYESDAMWPIWLDLQGQASSEPGQPTLAESVMGPMKMMLPPRIPKGGPTGGTDGTLNPPRLRPGDDQWSKNILFEPRRGAFAGQPGAVQDMSELGTVMNGGSHYYFWLGGMVEMLYGRHMITGGSWYEWAQKYFTATLEQANVQLAQYECGGSNFLSLWRRKDKFKCADEEAGNCNSKKLAAEVRRFVQGFPFFSSSTFQTEGLPMDNPLHTGYDVSTDANVIGHTFEGGASSTFGVRWSLRCMNNVREGETSRTASDCCGTGSDVQMGAFGEDSCLKVTATRGSLDLNFSGDPYMGSAHACVVTEKASLVVDVSVGAYPSVKHGPRDKPEAIEACRKAAEAYARHIVKALMSLGDAERARQLPNTPLPKPKPVPTPAPTPEATPAPTPVSDKPAPDGKGSSAEATLGDVEVPVKITGPDGENVAGANGGTLKPGQTLSTLGGHGRVRLRFDDGTVCVVHPYSVVRLDDAGNIILEQGAADFENQTGKPPSRQILTPPVILEEDGTVYSVKFDPATSRTTLSVQEGEVIAGSTDLAKGVRTLRAGEQVIAGPQGFGEITSAPAASSRPEVFKLRRIEASRIYRPHTLRAGGIEPGSSTTGPEERDFPFGWSLAWGAAKENFVQTTAVLSLTDLPQELQPGVSYTVRSLLQGAWSGNGYGYKDHVLRVSGAAGVVRWNQALEPGLHHYGRCATAGVLTLPEGSRGEVAFPIEAKILLGGDQVGTLYLQLIYGSEKADKDLAGKYRLDAIEVERVYTEAWSKPEVAVELMEPGASTLPPSTRQFPLGWHFRWPQDTKLNVCEASATLNLTRVPELVEPGTVVWLGATVRGGWNTSGFDKEREHFLKLETASGKEQWDLGWDPNTSYTGSLDIAARLEITEALKGVIDVPVTCTLNYGWDHQATLKLRFIYKPAASSANAEQPRADLRRDPARGMAVERWHGRAGWAWGVASFRAYPRERRNRSVGILGTGT